MNDTYSELLIKKEVTAKDKMIKVLLIALIALMAVAGLLITPLAFIAAIALGIAAYFVFPNLDLEFEYVYVNGELDIDKIMAKMKRKRAKSFELSKMEIMAPVKSHRLDYQNQNTKMKVYDFSSGNSSHKIFAMIISSDNELCKVLLEPDEELLKNIEKSCPRKVFVDNTNSTLSCHSNCHTMFCNRIHSCTHHRNVQFYFFCQISC